MFLNVIQLAESLGVEENVVEGWVRHEGLPHVTDRGRMLFDRAEVADWATSRGLAAKVGFLAPGRAQSAAGLKLAPLLRTGGIWRDVPAAGTLPLLADLVARLPGATPPIRQMLQQRLRAPNGISWALVGGGFALPHLRTPVALGREAALFALVLLREALTVNEPAPDDQPITRLLFFVAPSPRTHLEMLARLSATLARGQLRQRIVAAAPDDDLFAAVAAMEADAQPEGGA
jgi:PTS system nitrogen regulatory IIA component